MGAVKIGHDVQGGGGINSAFIDSGGKLAGITIGGSLLGGSNTDSGAIVTSGDVGAVKIGGDFKGAKIAYADGKHLASDPTPTPTPR